MSKAGAIPDSGMFFPYVDFILGDTNVTRDASGTPDRLISFNCNRRAQGTAMDFVIRLVDPEWYVLENLLVNAEFECKLRYGWYSHNGQNKIGPWYDCVIVKISESLQAYGTDYELGGIGLAEVAQFRTSEGNYGGGSTRISDIVTELCAKEGWTPIVDKTRSLKTHNGITTQTEEKRYCRMNETTKEFLNRLAKDAVRESDNESGYQVYIDCSTTPASLHFHPPRYGSGNPDRNEQTPDSDIRQFKYCLDTTSEVLSVEFDSDLLRPYLRGNMKVAVPSTVSVNRGTDTKTETGPTDKQKYSGSAVNLTTKQPVDSRTQFLTQHEQAAAARYRASTVPASAKISMKILGDPTLKPNQDIFLTIQLPGQHVIHPVSGRFHFVEITDYMINGEFTSSMTCIRMSMPRTGGASKDVDLTKKGEGSGANSAGKEGSLYDRAKNGSMSNISYQFGAKNSSKGSVDCSGWVTELMLENGNLDQSAQDAIRSGGSAAGITQNVGQLSGIQSGSSLDGISLQEGMLVSVDTGAKGWDAGRFGGIDHIGAVVADENGNLFVSQSSSSRGVNMVTVDQWQSQMQSAGKGKTTFYVVDPKYSSR